MPSPNVLSPLLLSRVILRFMIDLSTLLERNFVCLTDISNQYMQYFSKIGSEDLSSSLCTSSFNVLKLQNVPSTVLLVGLLCRLY